MVVEIMELEKSSKNDQDFESYKSDVSKYVQRFGCSASAALFDPNCEIFSVPNIKGVIGYRSTGGCVVVYGDPVCSPDDVLLLVDSFYAFCRKMKKNIVFVTTSERFTYWAKKQFGGSFIEVCEEEVLNPTIHVDPTEGSEGRMLRKKVNHAKNEGAGAFEYSGQDENLEKALSQAHVFCIQSRKGPQIFQSRVDLFSERSGKRWFYAKKGDSVVGVATLNRLDSRQGWLLNLLMATPDAPNGTTELIVMKILSTLHDEKCSFMTFGATPREELGEINGLGKFSTAFARFVFNTVLRFFHLDGRRIYWRKFMPDSERSFVLFSRPHVGLSEVFAIMKAMNATL